MQNIWERILDEPVLAVNLVNGVIALVVSFGLDISPDQKASIIGLFTVGLNLVARQAVTPNRKL